MNSAALAAALPRIILDAWSASASDITPLAGGMNSATAAVTLPSGRFLAKWVPSGVGEALRAGASAAARMAAGGLVAGEPLPSGYGELVVAAEGGSVCLLRYVPGTPLSGVSAAEQHQMAATLARAHQIGVPDRRQADFFEWVHPSAALLDAESWVRPAISAVRSEYDSLPAITWSTLHTDPAPEAFRLDELTGQVGLIDWTGSRRGPVLYDVASAVMYLGGAGSAAPFLRAYANCNVVPAQELDDDLVSFQRFRGGVQAAYFSQRILNSDLTGIASQTENWKGLSDAREMLRTLGVPLGEDAASASGRLKHDQRACQP